MRTKLTPHQLPPCCHGTCLKPGTTPAPQIECYAHPHSLPPLGLFPPRGEARWKTRWFARARGERSFSLYFSSWLSRASTQTNPEPTRIDRATHSGRQRHSGHFECYALTVCHQHGLTPVPRTPDAGASPPRSNPFTRQTHPSRHPHSHHSVSRPSPLPAIIRQGFALLFALSCARF